MSDTRILRAALVVFLVLGAYPADPALAQQPTRLDLGIAAGPAPYDLSGTGTTIAAAVRAPWQVQGWLVIEPSVGFLSYNSQLDRRTTYLFPELSLQGQLRLGSVRPFLGGGAGVAFVVGGEGETAATLHGVAGARLDIGPEWGVSGELRVRAVRPWAGNTAEFLFGVYRRLR